MKNRMQDLDFEQTVAFDSVKDLNLREKLHRDFVRLSVWMALRMRMQIVYFFIIYIKKWNSCSFWRSSETLYL